MDCKTYFEHYYGRLREYYKPTEERAIKKLLRELARVGAMSRDACFSLYRDAAQDGADEDDFQLTLINLENDFYVRFDAEKNRYEFACKLLRDWWLRHHGMEAR